MALATELTKLLDIRHPILLAPMGAVSGGKLAAAVTRAGGLGLGRLGLRAARLAASGGWVGGA